MIPYSFAISLALAPAPHRSPPSRTERNQYSDYYIWSVGKNYKKPGRKFVDNDYPRDGYYIRNFFECQPALNYGYYNPKPNHHWEQGYNAPGPTAVRAELKKIIAHWCDMGADGFRVDMAQSLVKSDNKNRDGVRRLWNEIFEWYNSAYPENIMLSEWSNPEQSLSAGFNIDLLIHNGIGGKVYRPLVCETTDKMVPTVCYFNRKGVLLRYPALHRTESAFRTKVLIQPSPYFRSCHVFHHHKQTQDRPAFPLSLHTLH